MLRLLTTLLGLVVGAQALAAEAPSLRLLEQHSFTGEVRALAVCAGRVWAATSGGLAVHDQRTGRHLVTLTTARGLPGNSLKAIACLAGDRVLAGGEHGAAIVSPARAAPSALRVQPVAGIARPDTYAPVSALLDRGEDLPTLVVLQRGLLRLTRTAGQAWRAAEAPAGPAWWHAAACGPKACALGDLAGTLALATRPELDRRLDWTDPRRRLMLDGPVLALSAHADHFAVATGHDLLLVEGNRIRPLLFAGPDGQGDRIRATALAPAGGKALLVGTADGRVFRLHDTRVDELARTDRGRITALAADGFRVWLGIEREGLHLVQPRVGEPGESLRPAGEICDNHVTRLVRHRRWLVAGTFDQGACVLTPKGWLPLPELPSPMVLGLASDGHDLYVATAGGIARFGRRLQPRSISKRDAKTLQWLAGVPANGATRVGPGKVALTSRFGVVRVFRKRNGRTWIRFTNHDRGAPWKMTGLAAAGGALFAASEVEGVWRLGLGAHPPWHLTDPRPLPESWVTDLSAVSADDVWVATCQHGAVHATHETAHRFGRAQGLPDERLTAIAADERGAFIGTLGGLAWASAEGGPVKTWGPADGIPDPRSAGLLREGDELWVGTEAGLARFLVGPDRLAQAR